MIINEQYEYDPQKDRLGKGGFGSVFKAQDLITKQVVALKFVPQSALPTRYSLAEEAQRLKDFEHPNLVKYYDFISTKFQNMVGEEDIMQIGVMEYVNGGDLGAYMRMPLARQENTLLSLLKGILQGLAFLHQRRIIHRDIKPQNILLHIQEGHITPKIADFSLSKQLSTEMTSVSATVGTYEYMSPEQLGKGNYKLGTATDIWAFGVLMYQLFSQELPFGSRRNGDSDGQIVGNIINDAVQADLDKIPERFRDTVQQCLQKNPTLRIQTAEEVLKMLFPEGTENNADSIPIPAEASNFFQLLDTQEDDETSLDTSIAPAIPELETKLSQSPPTDLSKTIEETANPLAQTRTEENTNTSPPPPPLAQSNIHQSDDDDTPSKKENNAAKYAVAIMILLFLLVFAWIGRPWLNQGNKHAQAQETEATQDDSTQMVQNDSIQEDSGRQNTPTYNTPKNQTRENTQNSRPKNENTRTSDNSSNNTPDIPEPVKPEQPDNENNSSTNQNNTNQPNRSQGIRYDYTEEGRLGKIVSKGGLYGFLDKEGNLLIPLQYDDFSYPQEGLAAVKKGNKWGFINLQNQVIIPFKYDRPGNFRNGRAEVTMGNRDFYIDKTGKCVSNCY